MRGGGQPGGWGTCSWACSQAAHGGLRVRPGNGFRSLERLGGALAGRGVVGPAVARSEGHTTWSMRHSHTRPTSSNWEKSGSGIMVLPPHTDGEMGLSYPIFRLPNYPQATGTLPFAPTPSWSIGSDHSTRPRPTAGVG